MTTTLIRMPVAGRHRLGSPGLIPVTALVTVVRRRFFLAWFRPGRHRRADYRLFGERAPQPAAAV
ncbi:MAG TPA: hypothetical protein VET27_06475 [Mycobacterium sp.]|nr:hypothetical protein [Mycobacterium sp.]